MKTINIKPQHFEELQKKGVSLDIVYLLQLIRENIDITPLLKENVKMQSLLLLAQRKNLVSPKNTLTLPGQEIFQMFSISVKSSLKKASVTPTFNFTEWWMAFPATDTFVIEGKRFAGTRSFRCKKEDCQKLYQRILDEGTFTHQQLLEALKYDVTNKKLQSLESRENKLKYLHNSYTYLYQRDFENYMDVKLTDLAKTEDKKDLTGYDL